jgi:hydrogenase nickel incorporation protein HypA/HybF
MHELGIATEIVDACAARAAGERVLRVRVQLGQLVAVAPDALRFCFEICTAGTPLQGATLEIEEVPGSAICESCGGTLALAAPAGRCACGGMLRILAGEELRVRDMEVA